MCHSGRATSNWLIAIAVGWIALAAVLLLGYWTWPGIFAGALAANAIAAEPLVTAAGVAAGNTLEALAGAWLLRRAIGFDPRLGRLGDVLGLVGLAAVVSTTISASIGAASLILTGVQQRGVLASVWWTWWVGDAIGDLVVAPVLLTWAVRPSDRARGRPGEALALAASLGVIAAIVFVGPLDPLGVRPLEYAVFPVVIWAALRFGPRGATTVTLVAAVVAIWGTLQGSGPFATGTWASRIRS